MEERLWRLFYIAIAIAVLLWIGADRVLDILREMLVEEPFGWAGWAVAFLMYKVMRAQETKDDDEDE